MTEIIITPPPEEIPSLIVVGALAYELHDIGARFYCKSEDTRDWTPIDMLRIDAEATDQKGLATFGVRIEAVDINADQVTLMLQVALAEGGLEREVRIVDPATRQVDATTSIAATVVALGYISFTSLGDSNRLYVLTDKGKEWFGRQIGNR